MAVVAPMPSARVKNGSQHESGRFPQLSQSQSEVGEHFASVFNRELNSGTPWARTDS